MTDQVFKPRVAPRNLADLLVTAGVGLVQVLVLIGLPGALAYAVSGNPFIALLCMTGANVVFALFSVSKVVCRADGLHFSRVLGTPKRIAWDAIVGVAEAPRRELLVRGWLWPIFPPRELTTSLTSIGHVRIDYGSRSVYFPPCDSAAFLAAIAAHRAAVKPAGTL
ncbi:hypothetical protein [Massilia sp. CF038]|uniref:hypothetical protein n=1 Tax=Massilia sp. CF038 TaxID=1881045 RepID=UPI0009138618|nr:hypothetical protein [Massilia sp. CF038]SHG73214.1 hypothetical protein SAMN05428948_1803 [Massilia sp. CF038]